MFAWLFALFCYFKYAPTFNARRKSNGSRDAAGAKPLQQSSPPAGPKLAFGAQVGLISLWLWVVTVLYNSQKSEACPRAKEIETWLMVDAGLGFAVIALASVLSIKSPLTFSDDTKQATILYFLVDSIWGVYGVVVLISSMMKGCQSTGGTLFAVLAVFVLAFCVLSVVTLAFVVVRYVNTSRKEKALARFKSRRGR